jgi:pilus assembly protein CpaC
MTSIQKVTTLGIAVFLAANVLGPAWSQSGPEDIRLTVGKSIVIDYPADIARISTSNPEIADASPVTTREVLIQGKAYGNDTLVVWNKAGQRNFYNITVEQNLDPLRKLLKDTFPADNIHVESSRDSLALTGLVSNKDVAERAMILATPFAKNIVNNVQIAAGAREKQVLLRVKFAELDRTAASQFAFNLVSTGATNTIGSVTTGQAPSASPSSIGGTSSSTFTISDALNIFAFRPNLNLAAFLQALQTRSVLQILAEPTIVTANGKEASFMVGGEFPVPVLQGGGNSGAVTIMFREFGVRLNFTPTITSSGTIRMHVKPEVSTLDYTNAVTLNGFTIPALSSRKLETNIELGEGQTFIIAGLIDSRVQDNASRIAGLSNLPIIGNLFKSKNGSKSRTELIVMVTPEITEPLQPGDVKPMPVMPQEFLKSISEQDLKADKRGHSK